MLERPDGQEPRRERDSRWNREASCGTMIIRSSANGESRLKGFFRTHWRVAAADLAMQVIGMTAVAKTSVECARWTWKLWRGPITRFKSMPRASELPIVKARPDELDTKRPSAIPPDSAKVYGVEFSRGDRISLPVLAD